MKKILMLSAICLFAASSAFAAASLTIETGFDDAGKELVGAAESGGTTSRIGKTSTGVGLGMLVDDTSGAGYAMVTQHKSGTKAFGSSYDSTAIYTTIADGTPGTVILDVPTATDTSDFDGTDWKAM